VAHRFLSIRGGQAGETRQDHDQVFVGRYRRLLAFARRFVAGDRDLADDLLHDAYVQFVVSRPELTQIADLDAYLTTLIRNLQVSSLRRKANQHHVPVGIEEYDSAERALKTSGPHQQANSKIRRPTCEPGAA
jgi:DNA-directed RNA polymerase specialized sigma24 family protein